MRNDFPGGPPFDQYDIDRRRRQIRGNEPDKTERAELQPSGQLTGRSVAATDNPGLVKLGDSEAVSHHKTSTTRLPAAATSERE